MVVPDTCIRAGLKTVHPSHLDTHMEGLTCDDLPQVILFFQHHRPNDCASTLKLVSEQLWVIQNTSCFNNLTAVVRGSCLLKSLEDLHVSSYRITFVPAFPATASVDNNPWPPGGFVPVTVSGWTLVSPVYILFPSFTLQSLTQLVMLSREIRLPHCWCPHRPTPKIMKGNGNVQIPGVSCLQKLKNIYNSECIFFFAQIHVANQNKGLKC